MSTNTYFTVCPHCGYQSEDDEMCQACGVLFDDSPDVSIIEAILEEMSGCVKKITNQPQDPQKQDAEKQKPSKNPYSLAPSALYGTDPTYLFRIDPSDDPGFAHLPGNSYHYVNSDE